MVPSSSGFLRVKGNRNCHLELFSSYPEYIYEVDLSNYEINYLRYIFWLQMKYFCRKLVPLGQVYCYMFTNTRFEIICAIFTLIVPKWQQNHVCWHWQSLTWRTIVKCLSFSDVCMSKIPPLSSFTRNRISVSTSMPQSHLFGHWERNSSRINWTNSFEKTSGAQHKRWI